MSALDELVAVIVDRAITAALNDRNQIRPETYTPSQAGKLLQLDESTVRDRCRKGLIGHLPPAIAGNRYLIPRAELDRVLAESTLTTASATPGASRQVPPPSLGVADGAAGAPPQRAAVAAVR